MFKLVTGKHPMLASGTRTSGGQSNAGNFGSAIEARVLVNVTVASGTNEKLTVFFDTSWNNSDWFVMTDVGNIQLTKVGKYSFPITNFGKYVRARYEITGTSASFTFQIDLVFKE